MIEYISIIAIPLMLFTIIVAGIIEKKDMLALFADGVKEGLGVMYKIFPHVLAIIVAVSLFKTTGAMDMLFSPLNNFLQKFGIPKDILTLAILRPISGGASTSVVMEIFNEFGPDSIQGKISSIIMGGTETTFYVITILFGAVGIKKIRGTLIVALIADVTAITLSIYLVLNNFV